MPVLSMLISDNKVKTLTHTQDPHEGEAFCVRGILHLQRSLLNPLQADGTQENPHRSSISDHSRHPAGTNKAGADRTSLVDFSSE